MDLLREVLEHRVGELLGVAIVLAHLQAAGLDALPGETLNPTMNGPEEDEVALESSEANGLRVAARDAEGAKSGVGLREGRIAQVEERGLGVLGVEESA